MNPQKKVCLSFPVFVTCGSEEQDRTAKLKVFRVRNINKIIIALININSVKNKIDLLAERFKENIDIFMILETKIANNFPTSQFIIIGFAIPFIFDWTDKGGVILVYVTEDIPSKLLRTPYIYVHTECLMIEMNLSKRKWILVCSYNTLKINTYSNIWTV